MLPLLPLVLSCVLLMLLHRYLTRHHTYWLKRNVPSPRPSVFFGNSRNVAMLRTTVGENLQEIYREYEGRPFVGIYELRTPALLLRDPKLIKHVLAKDFAYFQSRGIAANESADPLAANLIALNGQRWRILRTKLTPAFTAGKIRHIFGLFADVSEKFQQFVRQHADSEEPVEFRGLTEKFTTEVIASCFVGLDTNTLQNDDSEFLTMCKKGMGASLTVAIKRFVRDYMPGVFKRLSMHLNSLDVIAYFMRLTQDVIAHRRTNNVTRNDIMQVLMEMKDSQEDSPAQSQDVVINDKTIAAQVFIFLMAGIDTSAITTSFVLCELAANPEIQERLHDEIRAVYERHGRLSYDAINEIEYLDRVVRETLRKYPPVGMTQRVCGESYRIPDSDVILEKDTKVLVPIHAIHHDPLYYKDPDKFDPDRFLDENKKLRDNYTFIPFGEGPRICIGMRFAYVQIKVGLVALITNYRMELGERTTMPLEFHPAAFTLTTKSGIWLKLRHRLQDLTQNNANI